MEQLVEEDLEILKKGDRKFKKLSRESAHSSRILRHSMRSTKGVSVKNKAQSLSCVGVEDVPYVRMEKAADLFYGFTSYVISSSLSFLKFGL